MTVKSKTDLDSEISTNLANNVSGDISPADVRGAVQNVLDSVHGVYGQMYVVGGSSAQSLIDTDSKITGLTTSGLSNGVTLDPTTDDDITVGTAGVYLVIGKLMGTGVAAKTFSFYVAKNGTVDNGSKDAYTCTGTETFTVACVGLISCAANDLITLMGNSGEAGGNNYTLVDGSLTVHRIA